LCTYHIEFDFILICPHKPESLCECRKPNTLLGERAISEFSLDPGKSFMVGDQVSDIEFGRKLGMKTIGIRNELLVGQRLDYYCKDIFELSKLLP
jgi:HAD superfamily hydrolase (TIGR01662 family)